MIPLIAVAATLVTAAVENASLLLQRFRKRRMQHLEAEFRRQQIEAQAKLHLLTSVLKANAHQARKELIRAAFMASKEAQEQTANQGH